MKRGVIVKSVGQKIYEKNMEIRVTVRLDERHDNVLKDIMKEKNLNSKSEAIRYLIEKNQKNK